jgi:hypothetical protein
MADKDQLTVGKLRAMLGGLGNDVPVFFGLIDSERDSYLQPAFKVETRKDEVETGDPSSPKKTLKRVVIS